MLTLLIALLLSLVVLVQIKLDYNTSVEPVVKHDEQPAQTLAVAYILPKSPLKLLDVPRETSLKEVIPDRRAQYKEWKDNLKSYEQVRLKLYTQ